VNIMRALLLLVAGSVIGCGTDKSPVEKCDDLINVLCDRGVECLPNAGDHTTCVQQVQQSIPCGTAKSVSATYDRCVNELMADSCPVLFPPDPQSGQPTLKLPADCMSVVLSRTGAAPSRSFASIGGAISGASAR
jgi:hypothetical protein